MRSARAPRALRRRARLAWAGATASGAVSPPLTHAQAQARPLRVIILGAPASGKGTQVRPATRARAAAGGARELRCARMRMPIPARRGALMRPRRARQCELIVAKYGLAHVSSGDLLRSEVDGCTAYGEASREAVASGELAPDDVVVPLVVGRLGEDDAVAKGWLLDGFPRSAAQAAALADAGFAPELLIVLEVPEAVLLARVAGRVLDPATGKIYNRDFSPAPPEAQDRLQTRADDGAEATARTRLAVFAAHADAVLARYADVAVRVDGDRHKDAVFADVSAAIAAALARQKA